jgi:hypothetical protein
MRARLRAGRLIKVSHRGAAHLGRAMSAGTVYLLHCDRPFWGPMQHNTLLATCRSAYRVASPCSAPETPTRLRLRPRIACH